MQQRQDAGESVYASAGKLGIAVEVEEALGRDDDNALGADVDLVANFLRQRD